MEPRILTIILLHIGICVASHHSHTIPIEGYESELQNLGEHVEIPETPIKVIKITKTVAVKIPVPYPVKVVEKVPYPVHVNKPYPVPVPQIVHAPYTPKAHEQEALGGDHGFQGNVHTPFAHERQAFGGGHGYQGNDDGSYQVQDNSEHNQSPSYNGPSYGGYAPISEEYGISPNDHNNYYLESNGPESNAAIQSHSYHSEGDDN